MTAFGTNPLRVEHRQALHDLIAEVIGALDGDTVTARLDAAGIAWGHTNDVTAFINHPQLTARHRWREVDSPTGPLRVLLPPVEIDGCEPRLDAVPSLGADTAAILEELGYDQPAIAAFRTEGVI